jgi:hypothetical protein
MKYIWIAVAVLALSATAHAQCGGCGGSLRGPVMPALSHTSPATFTNVIAHGDDSFIPSAFLPWSEAVAFGNSESQKTLGEIAREFRGQKKVGKPSKAFSN